ncbi:MAG: hypothetical protein ACXVGA_04290 [Mycobacteriaceae bacterium]
MTIDRCTWSELPTNQCAHCGAAPGDRPRLDPPTPMRHAAARADDSTLEKPRLPDIWAAGSDAGECRCGRPTRDDAFLCDDCQGRFTTLLSNLGQLVDEVDVTITRQRGAATTGGPRSTSTSLPWHEAAANARRNLHGLLASWVRLCDEDGIRGPQIEFPADTVAAMASWLGTRVRGLALHDFGGDAMDEITDAAAECHRIIFWKRRSRTYLGPCRSTEFTDEDGQEVETDPCPGEVYAEEGEAVGYCDLCRQGATVVIKRAALENELDMYLATASEIARLATYLGLDVPRDVVRKRVLYWHRHKRIEQRSADAAGLPMFRYGEARGLLYADFAKRAS